MNGGGAGTAGQDPVTRPVGAGAEWTVTFTVDDAPPMPLSWGVRRPDDPPFRPDRVTVLLTYSTSRPEAEPRWRVSRVDVAGVGLARGLPDRVSMTWYGDLFAPQAWKTFAPDWLARRVDWLARVGPGVSW